LTDRLTLDLEALLADPDREADDVFADPATNQRRAELAIRLANFIGDASPARPAANDDDLALISAQIDGGLADDAREVLFERLSSEPEFLAELEAARAFVHHVTANAEIVPEDVLGESERWFAAEDAPASAEGRASTRDQLVAEIAAGSGGKPAPMFGWRPSPKARIAVLTACAAAVLVAPALPTLLRQSELIAPSPPVREIASSSRPQQAAPPPAAATDLHPPSGSTSRTQAVGSAPPTTLANRSSGSAPNAGTSSLPSRPLGDIDSFSLPSPAPTELASPALKPAAEGARTSAPLSWGGGSAWAAIAYSPSTGQAGSARGRSSQRDAEAAAAAQCRLQGASDCAIQVSRQGQCLALAGRSDGSAAAGAGASPAAAGEEALRACRATGAGSCSLRVSVCGPP